MATKLEQGDLNEAITQAVAVFDQPATEIDVELAAELPEVLLDGDDSLPVNFTVRGPRGSMTELDGSRLKRGITFADAEFTSEGLKQLTAPRGAPE